MTLAVKNPPAIAEYVRDMGSVPGLGGPPGGGNGNPLQYSCLETPKDRGAWWATVHDVAKSETWLGDWAPTKQRGTGYWGNCARDGEEQLWAQNSGGRLQRRVGLLRNVAVSLETSRGTPTASNYWPARAFRASAPQPQTPPRALCAGASGPLLRRHAARLAASRAGLGAAAPHQEKGGKGVSAHSG